jgi:subtilisin family serine protease
MAHFKVIVPRLRVRSKPVEDISDLASRITTINEGFHLDLELAETNSLGEWYKDNKGQFYWGRGLKEMSGVIGINQTQQLTASSIFFDYKEFIKNIGTNWIESSPENITIALIDTGVINNTNYLKNVQQIIISNENNKLYHGNFIAGILNGTKKIIGCSNASLLSLKYQSDGDSLFQLLTNINKTLNILITLDSPLIINISQGFNNSIDSPEYSILLAEIKNKLIVLSAKENTLLICAAGDNLDIKDARFPANLPFCVSVGNIGNRPDVDISNSALNILSPNIKYTSFDNNFEKVEEVGSSFSTPIIAALAAKYLCSNKKISKKDFLNALLPYSTERKDFNFGNFPSFQFQILNQTS